MTGFLKSSTIDGAVQRLANGLSIRYTVRYCYGVAQVMSADASGNILTWDARTGGVVDSYTLEDPIHISHVQVDSYNRSSKTVYFLPNWLCIFSPYTVPE